jgi:hypothetical protein
VRDDPRAPPSRRFAVALEGAGGFADDGRVVPKHEASRGADLVHPLHEQRCQSIARVERAPGRVARGGGGAPLPEFACKGRCFSAQSGFKTIKLHQRQSAQSFAQPASE